MTIMIELSDLRRVQDSLQIHPKRFSENEKTIEGDIYISTKRIDENAKKYSVSFNQELLRIMIHGMLHLIGYSDKNQEGKTTMFSKENKYLSMYNKK